MTVTFGSFSNDAIASTAGEDIIITCRREDPIDICDDPALAALAGGGHVTVWRGAHDTTAVSKGPL